MGSKTGKPNNLKTKCFGTSLEGTVDLFWGPKRAKVSLDGLPKWSKRADIAISSDFKN